MNQIRNSAREYTYITAKHGEADLERVLEIIRGLPEMAEARSLIVKSTAKFAMIAASSKEVKNVTSNQNAV